MLLTLLTLLTLRVVLVATPALLTTRVSIDGALQGVGLALDTALIVRQLGVLVATIPVAPGARLVLRQSRLGLPELVLLLLLDALETTQLVAELLQPLLLLPQPLDLVLAAQDAQDTDEVLLGEHLLLQSVAKLPLAQQPADLVQARDDSELARPAQSHVESTALVTLLVRLEELAHELDEPQKAALDLRRQLASLGVLANDRRRHGSLPDLLWSGRRGSADSE